MGQLPHLAGPLLPHPRHHGFFSPRVWPQPGPFSLRPSSRAGRIGQPLTSLSQFNTSGWGPPPHPSGPSMPPDPHTHQGSPLGLPHSPGHKESWAQGPEESIHHPLTCKSRPLQTMPLSTCPGDNGQVLGMWSVVPNIGAGLAYAQDTQGPREGVQVASPGCAS